MKQAWIFLLTVVFLFSICPCSLGQEVTPKVKEEYTEERGLALAELFWLVVDLVENDLTPEEKDIYATLIPIHLQNLYQSDDWQRFEKDLTFCKTADDLRHVLAGNYVGITQPESGRPGRMESTAMMEQLMAELKLFSIFPLVFYGPLHATSSYSEAWEILAMQPAELTDREVLLQLLLTQDGTVVSVNALALEGAYEFEKTERGSLEEKRAVLERATALTNTYSICRGRGGLLRPMMLSEFFYQGHNLDESLAFLWVGYGSSDVNPSQEETYVSENDEDDSNFGDALLLGVSSQRVYYWKSFVSKQLALSAITEEGISIP